MDYWTSLEFAPGPLWFVEVLLAVTLVYVLGRAISAGLGALPAGPAPTTAKKPLSQAWYSWPSS